MSGLDDLLGSLTKSKGGDQGGQAGLGLDDLLGGLLGGGRGLRARAPAACRTSSAASSAAVAGGAPAPGRAAG